MSDGKMIGFKNTKRGTDKKGREMTTYYLDSETAATLVEELQANLGNERGVKIQVHTEEKLAQWGPSLSSFGFVSPVQAPGANYGKGPAAGGKFVPKVTAKAGMSTATRARAAATLNTEVD